MKKDLDRSFKFELNSNVDYYDISCMVIGRSIKESIDSPGTDETYTITGKGGQSEVHVNDITQSKDESV